MFQKGNIWFSIIYSAERCKMAIKHEIQSLPDNNWLSVFARKEVCNINCLQWSGCFLISCKQRQNIHHCNQLKKRNLDFKSFEMAGMVISLFDALCLGMLSTFFMNAACGREWYMACRYQIGKNVLGVVRSGLHRSGIRKKFSYRLVCSMCV